MFIIRIIAIVTIKATTRSSIKSQQEKTMTLSTKMLTVTILVLIILVLITMPILS